MITNKEKKNMSLDNFKIPVAVVFIGPPGSGKGTTASRLQEDFKIKSLSPGEIFKNIRSQENELANLVIESTKDGGLCPDWLTNKIVEHESKKIIENGYTSISLDGYPRTIEQLEYLNTHFDVKLFVHANSDYNTLEKMITNRRNCKTCKKVFSKNLSFSCGEQDKLYCAANSEANWEIRWDDNPELFQKRYTVYEKQTLPIIEKVCNLKNYMKLNLFDEESYKVICQFVQ